MSFRPIQILIAAGSLLVVLLGAYTVFWYVSVSGIQKGLERWASDHRQKGFRLSLGHPILSGFPFQVHINFEKVDMAGPENSWRWIAPPIIARVRPWDPHVILIKAPGVHTVKVLKDTRIFQLKEAVAHFNLLPGKLGTGAIRLSGIKVTSPVSAKMTAQSVVIKVKMGAKVQTKNNILQNNTALTLDVRDLSIPKVGGQDLKNNISRFFINALVIGDVPFSNTLTGTLNAWRERGGSIDIHTLGLDWEALSLRANGTLALDKTLQPQGAMSVEIEGLEPTLHALINAGVIDARTAFAAKFANRTFSIGKSKVRLPLSVQKQRLYIGPVPVQRFRPIRWK